MAETPASRFVESKISQRPVVLFSKSYCPDSRRIQRLLTDSYLLKHPALEVIHIERRQDVNQIEDYFMVMCLSERRQLPQLYVDGTYIGNEEKVTRLHDNGSLEAILLHAGAIKSSMSTTKKPSSAGFKDTSTTFFTSSNSTKNTVDPEGMRSQEQTTQEETALPDAACSYAAVAEAAVAAEAPVVAGAADEMISSTAAHLDAGSQVNTTPGAEDQLDRVENSENTGNLETKVQVEN